MTGLMFSGEMTGCFAIIVHILPLNKRPVFTDLMACVESLATISAPVVGSALTQSLGVGMVFSVCSSSHRNDQGILPLTFFVGSTFPLED